MTMLWKKSLTILAPTDKVSSRASFGLGLDCLFLILLPKTRRQCDNALKEDLLNILWPTDKVFSRASLGLGLDCLYLNLATIDSTPVWQCSERRAIYHFGTNWKSFQWSTTRVRLRMSFFLSWLPERRRQCDNDASVTMLCKKSY